MEKATAAPPSTSRSSSDSPRIPPTKRILLSVRGSPIPSREPNILSWRIDTSSPFTGSSVQISGLAADTRFRPDTFLPAPSSPE